MSIINVFFRFFLSLCWPQRPQKPNKESTKFIKFRYLSFNIYTFSTVNDNEIVGHNEKKLLLVQKETFVSPRHFFCDYNIWSPYRRPSRVDIKTKRCLTARVSVQGVVSLGGHFATLCREFDFYEVKQMKNIIIFQKEKGNTFTLLIIFIVKSLQKEQNSTNLLLWPPICRNKRAITPKWINS